MLSKQIKFYGKYIKKMFDWRLAEKKRHDTVGGLKSYENAAIL